MIDGERIVLLALKRDKTLQVYASGVGEPLRFVRSYPILAASGKLGPKLKEGDFQVPEGVYPIEALNPNSAFHLSLRVGYPTEFDQAHAAGDGRTDLGGDIMIHGAQVSAGCLAMGDQVAEDLFVLAADVGRDNVKVVIAPVDFRRGETVPLGTKLPAWTPELYAQVKAAMAELPER